MNTRTITHAKIFTSFVLLTLVMTAQAEEWKVDFSRRFPNPSNDEIREPASTDRPIVVDDSGVVNVEPTPAPVQPNKEESASAVPGFLESVFSSTEPAQEIVVLNTEKGFIPSQVRIKQGSTYKFYIVNVNESEKNVSFVLDSFSEHHATYYGKIKSFIIRPQKEGVYRFVSPETSAQGKLVVSPLDKNGRVPAAN